MNPVDPTRSAALTAPAARNDRAELKRLAHELEALFVGQLFKAMRESTSKSGLVEPAPGEEMFTSWFDDELARQAARRMDGGLGDAIVRQLSRGLDTAATPLTTENGK